jgi:Putative lumazine-binding
VAEIDDYDAIDKVIKQYIEGAAKGDKKLLDPIFHKEARLFGEGPPKGKRYDLDRKGYFEAQAAEPLNADGNYRARLVSVQQLGPSAIAIVEEDGCWGTQNVSFVDIFSMSRINGEWKIVNKTYTWRGGGD